MISLHSLRRLAPASIVFVSLGAAGCEGCNRPTNAVQLIALQGAEGDVALGDFSGVVSGPAAPFGESGCVAPDVFAEGLRNAGVTTIRNGEHGDDTLDLDLIYNCSGGAYEPCDGQYPCWSGCAPVYPDGCGDLLFEAGNGSDARAEAILDGGFGWVLRVGSSASVDPKLAMRTHFGPSESEDTGWIAAMSCEVARYRAMAGDALEGVEVLGDYSDKTWDVEGRGAEGYGDLTVRALDALAGMGVTEPIGVGGFHEAELDELRDASCDTSAIAVFLERLADAGIAPAWIGVHLTEDGLDDNTERLAMLRALLDGESPCYEDASWAGTSLFAETTIHVSAHAPSSDAPFSEYTGKEGGARTGASLIAMQAGGAVRAFAHRAAGDDRGILRCDGRRTPRGSVIALWGLLASRTPTQGSIVIRSDLYALEAVGEGGKRAVFLANASSEAAAYELMFAPGDQRINAFSNVCLHQVNDVDDGVEAYCQIVDPVLTIPGHTVQLVTLDP